MLHNVRACTSSRFSIISIITCVLSVNRRWAAKGSAPVQSLTPVPPLPVRPSVRHSRNANRSVTHRRIYSSSRERRSEFLRAFVCVRYKLRISSIISSIRRDASDYPTVFFSSRSFYLMPRRRNLKEAEQIRFGPKTDDDDGWWRWLVVVIML